LASDTHLELDFSEKFLNFVIREVIRHQETTAAENDSGALQRARRGWLRRQISPQRHTASTAD